MPNGNQISEEISMEINDTFSLMNCDEYRKSKSPPNSYYRVNDLHGKTSNDFHQSTRVSVNDNNTALIESRYQTLNPT